MSTQNTKAERLANVIVDKAPLLMKFHISRNLVEDLRLMQKSPASLARIESIFKPYFWYKDLKQIHLRAPRKYAGGILLNLLGYQVFRTIFHIARWKFRRLLNWGAASPEVLNAVTELDKSGVVVIPDFLSSQESSDLLDEFNRLNPKFINHFPEFKEGVVAKSCTPCWTKPITAESCNKLVVQNQRIREIIEHASGIKSRFTPEVSYLEYSIIEENTGNPQSDGQDRLHADVVYPSYKAFIYLGSVDTKSGAFNYCPGSQKLSLRRLWLEYKCSIRHYLEPLFRGEFKPVYIDKNNFRSLGAKEVPQVGEPGTLIIFNTMGYHRRGDFLSGGRKTRRLIHANFRFLDSLANRYSRQGVEFGTTS